MACSFVGRKEPGHPKISESSLYVGADIAIHLHTFKNARGTNERPKSNALKRFTLHAFGRQQLQVICVLGKWNMCLHSVNLITKREAVVTQRCQTNRTFGHASFMIVKVGQQLCSSLL